MSTSTLTERERATMSFEPVSTALPGDKVYELAEVRALQAQGWSAAADIFARNNYLTANIRTDEELRAVINAQDQDPADPQPGRATPLEKAIAAGVLRVRAAGAPATAGAGAAAVESRLDNIERAVRLIAQRLGVAL